MSGLTTPTTSRGREGLRKYNFPGRVAETVTSFFQVRKRTSEMSSANGIKRRRSMSREAQCFSSPVSVASSPNRMFASTLHLISEKSPQRVFEVSDCPVDFGIFADMPIDVVELLLHRISYNELRSLSITSNKWLEKIENYLRSAKFRRRWSRDIQLFDQIESSKDHYTSKDPYFCLGLLLRQVSALKSTWGERLQLYSTFFSLQIMSTSGCGRTLHALTREYEKLTVSQFSDIVNLGFCSFPNLRQTLDNILGTSNESYRQLIGTAESFKLLDQEMKVRKTIHELYLNNRSSDPTSFFNAFLLSSLFQIYKPFGTGFQSKLLFLLYAPTILFDEHEVINWHIFAELVVNSEEEAASLKPIADALRALLLSKSKLPQFPWTKNAVFNLMEEVTTYPAPWSMNTFVSLLLTQPCLISIAITARMQSNHENEAGDMVCTMKTLLFRWNIDINKHLSSAFAAIKGSLTKEHCIRLKDSIWEWHRRNVNEFRQGSDVDAISDIQSELNSQIAILPLLAKLEES